MVVLSLAAGLILGIGAPSFNEFRRNNRLTGVANDFLSAPSRSRAPRPSSARCRCRCAPRTNPAAHAATCAATFRGWIVFVDANNNCLRADDGHRALHAGGTPIDWRRAQADLQPSRTAPAFPSAPLAFVSPSRPGHGRTAPCSATSAAPHCSTGTNQSAGRGIEVTPTGRVARHARARTDRKHWRTDMSLEPACNEAHPASAANAVSAMVEVARGARSCCRSACSASPASTSRA